MSIRICSILDIPDEILVKIILHFNARERLALAHSCTRMNTLVFGDKELMRDLDFSKLGRFTTAEDIQEYFGKENTRQLVLRVNIQNINCMKPGKMLNDTIGKATKLVDMNLHGTKFEDIVQIGSFLGPLIHLKRLSIDWPQSEKNNVTICRKFLQKPLSKLTYFSAADVSVSSKEFLPTVQLCDELEELRIVTISPHNNLGRNMSWSLESNKPRKLKIVQVRGWHAGLLKEHLITMLADLQEWTDFQLVDIFREQGFYLEKKVEVCQELRKTELMKSIPYLYLHRAFDFGCYLISECLLREVIKISHEDAPETFCCLKHTSWALRVAEKNEEPCLLNIDEAKRLLKDPGYQISFLHIKHRIESDCDAHLIASAFPNLTELVLSHILKTKDTVPKTEKKHFQRRLRRRGSTASEIGDVPLNVPSSFQMLVENTPCVKDLTIYSRGPDKGFEIWDLDALHLIPRWTNLKTLRLAFIPVTDGKFLIEIGKQCLQLEKIILDNLGFSNPCCYTSDLSQMLKHCRNLTDFSIQQGNIDEISNLINSLTHNEKLKTVRVINLTIMQNLYNMVELTPSIEQLLYLCQKLTTFVFITGWMSENDFDELASALQRIIAGLKRSNFQFQGPRPHMKRTVYEDASPSFFPRKLDETVFSFL